jgi:preprotein translocase subunit SecF
MPQDFSARIIAWSGDLQTVQALLALLAVGLLMLVVLALRLRRALSAGGAR